MSLAERITEELGKYSEKEFSKISIIISPDLEKKMKRVSVRLNLNKSYDFPIIVDDAFLENTFEVELNGS